MPELPEVESARQVVETRALGRQIADVDDRDTYECRPHEPGEIRSALVGRELTTTHRRGKAMWCETSDGGPLLGIHLGMSGRIHVSASDGRGGGRDARKAEWDRFTITFEDGGTLRLFDKRRLGRIRLDPDLSALGPDAAEISRDDFRTRIGKGNAPLKARLLDQGAIAGIGNLLADEVLWQSHLSPQRRTADLAVEELDELRRHLCTAIRTAIRQGGVHTGEIIKHRRRDEHCPRCGAEMTRATVGGRTTWWCPVEQA